MQNKLEHSDIINLSKDGYIIIYVCNDLALIFSTDVPSEQQLLNIKKEKNWIKVLSEKGSMFNF